MKTLHIKVKGKDVFMSVCVELIKNEYPVLCVCKNRTGTLYLCNCLNATPSVDEWIITETDKVVLEKLICGEIAVRQAFLFYDTVYRIWKENGISKETKWKAEEAPETLFPNKRLYMSNTPSEDARLLSALSKV